MAPQQGQLVGGEEDSSHARFGSVTSSKDDWVFWHDFGKAGWTFPEAGNEGLEVVNVAAEMLADFDSVLVGVLEPMLEDGEEPFGTGNGKRHKTEFTEDFSHFFWPTRRFPRRSSKRDASRSLW